MSWLVLSLSSKLIHQSIPGKRLALSALAGGLSSLLILIPAGTVWQTILLYALKCISMLIVLLTAFYKNGMSKRRIFYAVASFFGVNLLFSGGVYLFQSMLGTKVVYIKGHELLLRHIADKAHFYDRGSVYSAFADIPYIRPKAGQSSLLHSAYSDIRKKLQP